MDDIYKCTLRPRLGSYTIGLIDLIDPNQRHYFVTDVLNEAARIVLNWLDYGCVVDQIVVFDKNGIRKKILVAPYDPESVEHPASIVRFI